jgi:hypothetical protein
MNLGKNPYKDLSVEFIGLPLLNYKKQYDELKDYAVRHGCAHQNRSTLFLRHIYAGDIGEELSRLLGGDDLMVFNAHELLSYKAREEIHEKKENRTKRCRRTYHRYCK